MGRQKEFFFFSIQSNIEFAKIRERAKLLLVFH